MAKAKEALERKRRKAEKARARDAERALKEAEKKEKEREKRARKKERRKAAMATDDASITDEAVFAPATAETPKESKNEQKPTVVPEAPQNPSQIAKQTKAKSIPPPLRRRMQPWMWVILTCLLTYALFLIGNYV
ncbi:hypothetical protein like AT1G20970 [Hibiscus trionum]|uniref:Uncharacterized protein n=1 Tax=Hibiscus trionum TaxID=183268 RepID=A0A9W7LG47_HIBTR|nr:hypothetical protein like AT1G20970 [Hibiscus trionum]